MNNVVPRERGILFRWHWAAAIAVGNKTQTRRLLDDDDFARLDNARMFDAEPLACRHGVPGDRLWTREPFFPTRNGRRAKSIDEAEQVHYRDYATKYRYTQDYQPGPSRPYSPAVLFKGAWRPSIHQPRWASRALVEITDVRIEPLQDLTIYDARAEGIPEYRSEFADGGSYTEAEEDEWRNRTSAENFRWVWDRRNKGPASWDANPLVWVITFKLLEPALVAPEGRAR